MKKVISIFIALLVSSNSFAQKISLKDYNRAVSFLSQNLLNKKVFNANTQFNWFADSTGLTFFSQNKDGKIFSKIDWKTKKVERLFDHERLAKLLTDSLKTEYKASNLPFTSVKYIDLSHLEFAVPGKEYALDLNKSTLSPKKREVFNNMERKSPDGKWIAYSQGYNLFIKSTITGQIKQLSKTGSKNYEYATFYGWGELIEGENGERPPHFNVRWSPDSKWIHTYLCDLRKGQKMYLLDWSVDTLYRARLLSYYRGSPGDTNMVYMTPVFFNIETGEETLKHEFRNVNAASCQWAKESGVAYITNTMRGYQQVDLYWLDLATQTQKKIYSEKSTTNIDNFDYQFVPNTNQIIITSEKEGWKQLYLLDLKDESLKPITNGAYYVNDILYVEPKSQVVFFTASGKEAGRNPYFQHFYRITLDGKNLTLLTPENANHDITISPDGQYFTDNTSTFNQPTRSVLRESTKGSVVAELMKATTDELLAMNYRFPEEFTTTARDGKTTIYGAIWKPSHFDSSKKYPVIDQSYTGPHTFMFPRNFISAIGRSNQALAELGFIVVAIDGMGTANRSKAFHNVSYKNMGKNLTDHVLAIQALGKRYSWIDTERVGIFGHSAGGYDAGHAVLEFPDFL
ncbi:MAG: DPP IV N-terminal domain-containing protein [Spirosomataceae bacterium]